MSKKKKTRLVDCPCCAQKVAIDKHRQIEAHNRYDRGEEAQLSYFVEQEPDEIRGERCEASDMYLKRRHGLR